MKVGNFTVLNQFPGHYNEFFDFFETLYVYSSRVGF
jgi:hypothetical protein